MKYIGIVLGFVLSVQQSFGVLSESFESNRTDAGVLVESIGNTITIQLDDRTYELELDRLDNELKFSQKTGLSESSGSDIEVINRDSYFDIGLMNKLINLRCHRYNGLWHITLFNYKIRGKACSQNKLCKH